MHVIYFPTQVAPISCISKRTPLHLVRIAPFSVPVKLSNQFPSYSISNQATIVRHRYRPSPGCFQHLEVEYDRSHKKTTLLSVDAQIVSNEFLMRSQMWVLLPWSRRDDFIEELTHEYWSFNICMHTRGRLKDSPVMDLMKSGLDMLEGHARGHAQILTCPCCWIDYVLDARDFGERGFAVLVTRWMNLGAGLDSADAKWNSHIIGRNPVDVHDIRRDPGDIRKGFEDEAGMSVEALTADNERKLFSRRQFRLISRGGDGCVWKWDRGEQWYLAPSGPAEKSFWQSLAGE